MSEINTAISATSAIVKGFPAWFDNLCTVLEKHHLMPVGDWRKKIMQDKNAVQLELDAQRRAHERAMHMLDADASSRIKAQAVIAETALNAVQEDVKNNVPITTAFSEHYPLAVRATSQLYAETLTGQYAKERIALYAIEEVAQHPNASINEGVTSKTFEARFWEYAKGVRDEEAMQQWGKLLANEIKQPCSFSLRTLDILRCMSNEDALFFQKIAKYVIKKTFIAREDNNDFISQYEVMTLEQCGVIVAGKAFPFLDKAIIAQNAQFDLISTNNTGKKFNQQVLVLTNEGRDLLKLTNISKNEYEEGIKYTQNIFKQKGIETVIRPT